MDITFPQNTPSRPDRDKSDLGHAIDRLEARLARRPDSNAEDIVPSISAAPVIETEAFRKWFGSSKVVDEEGGPLVMHHGTKAKFEAFDYERIQDIYEGVGFYFTHNREFAAGYGDVVSVYLSIQKPLRFDTKPFDKRVTRAILKRVAEIEALATGMGVGDGFLANFGDVRHDGFERVLGKAVENVSNDETANDQIAGIFQSGVSPGTVVKAVNEVTGYDGISADGFTGVGAANNRIFIAWFPAQIKSAAANSGKFDPTNPVISA